jgi:hypothetical protein
LLAFAERLTGAARFTSRVVDAVCVTVPLLPVIVSDHANGMVALVVDIVSFAVPAPLMVDGVKPKD